MAIVTRNHGTVSFVNGAFSLELGPGEGNFTFDGLEELNADGVPEETAPIESRGTFLERVKVREKEITGSITVYQDGQITDNSTGKPLDVATFQSTALSALTTVDPGGVVQAGNIEWSYTRNGVSGGLRFKNCRLVASGSEGTPSNTFTLNFDCREGVEYL